jgi:SAM-dependent methyltransferase
MPEHHPHLRTDDTAYGESYWTSYGGDGYGPSPVWEDLAHILKELWGYRDGQDVSGSHNLLDVGCATGLLVQQLRRRGFDAWGCDFSEWALQHAPSDTREFLRPFNLEHPNGPFWGYESFDLLTCFETLEHIHEEHVMRALVHLFQILRPGGQGVLSICMPDQPDWDTDPTHVCIRPREWWAERLQWAGFGLLDEPVRWLRGFHQFSSHGGVFVVEKPSRGLASVAALATPEEDLAVELMMAA